MISYGCRRLQGPASKAHGLCNIKPSSDTPLSFVYHIYLLYLPVLLPSHKRSSLHVMISSHLFPNYDWTNEKHMATFAESLLARNFGIRYPKPAPTMTHKIKADVVFRMFNNILRPLLTDIEADDETIRAHDEAVESVAFDALWATCLLLHKRGGTHLHTLYARAANLPVDGFGRFPVYVAALIDDFGPVRGLNGATHVPYLLYDEVQALKPQTYTASTESNSSLFWRLVTLQVLMKSTPRVPKLSALGGHSMLSSGESHCNVSDPSRSGALCPSRPSSLTSSSLSCSPKTD